LAENICVKSVQDHNTASEAVSPSPDPTPTEENAQVDAPAAATNEALEKPFDIDTVPTSQWHWKEHFGEAIQEGRAVPDSELVRDPVPFEADKAIVRRAIAEYVDLIKRPEWIWGRSGCVLEALDAYQDS